MLRVCVFLLAGLSVVTAAKFPSYITRCSLSGPDFSACALASARAAKDTIIKGDRKIHLPVLDPLRVTELSVAQTGGVGLNITLKDIEITGLADSVFEDDFTFDPVTRYLAYSLMIPRLEINSDYVMKGKILILPINGEGKANFTLQRVMLKASAKFNLVPRANGKEYAVFEPATIGFTTKKAYIYLQNLFNGDPLLGPQTNLFLNDNWESVVNELGPSIAEGIASGVQQSLQGFADRYPFDELTLP